MSSAGPRTTLWTLRSSLKHAHYHLRGSYHPSQASAHAFYTHIALPFVLGVVGWVLCNRSGHHPHLSHTIYCTPYVGAHFLHSHSIDNRHSCLASSVEPCTTILDTILISHTPSTIYHLLLYSLPMSQASGRRITGLSKSIIKHGSQRSLRTIDVLKAGKQIQRRENANAKRQSCIQGMVTILPT